MPNNSPWIHQLDKNRKKISLESDIKTDVVVVGAGIAGISTAFFTLKHTNKKVVVIERDLLAHGATGHNAGYVVGNFERPFRDLVKEFGLEMAASGVREIEESWALLDAMYEEAELTMPMHRTMGHGGLSTEEQVLAELEDNWWRREGNLHPRKILISEEADFFPRIPSKYDGLFFVVPIQEMVSQLETFDPNYIAVVLNHIAVMNSALLCEQMVNFLDSKYPERFKLYEQTSVGKVVLKEGVVLLDTLKHTVECGEVVLCTNGFENIEIFTSKGLSINTRFHHSINGVIAFMSGFLENLEDAPGAFYYYQKEDKNLTDNPGDPYFYVSRRPYEYEEKVKHNLICIGGPDHGLEDRAKYSRHEDYPGEAYKVIDEFVRRTYEKKKDFEYAFHWHGVMGYTANMVRMVGVDPEHSRLFYNLGCNGIGILPSIFGGDRVARMIAGEKFPPSMFDIPKRAVESATISQIPNSELAS
jgi:glycine/D-amino acid oxidase-like deaminating enzyme